MISELHQSHVILQWEFQPLSDNAAWHTHSYKLSIQAGPKGGSLGNEKIKMKLIGENGFTRARVLDDGERKVVLTFKFL